VFLVLMIDGTAATGNTRGAANSSNSTAAAAAPPAAAAAVTATANARSAVIADGTIAVVPPLTPHALKRFSLGGMTHCNFPNAA